MKYNERIREIREDNSLTQQKIADRLHIGQRTYADYESGKTRIPVDSLLILAKFYNVSMDYITGASNIKTEYPKQQAAVIILLELLPIAALLLLFSYFSLAVSAMYLSILLIDFFKSICNASK